MDKNQGYAILKAVMLENGTRICIGRTSHRAIPLCHIGLL